MICNDHRTCFPGHYLIRKVKGEPDVKRIVKSGHGKLLIVLTHETIITLPHLDNQMSSHSASSKKFASYEGIHKTDMISFVQSPPKESIHFCRAEYSKLRGGK